MADSKQPAKFYFDYYLGNLIFYETVTLNASGPAALDPKAYDSNLALYSGSFRKMARNCNGASCFTTLMPGQTKQYFIINEGT